MAVHWPDWWDWEIELTPHLLKRMIDRGFNEVDLRQMLDKSTGIRKSAVEGRYVIFSPFQGERWEIIVEPDPDARQLLVITAYVRDQS
jgi:hypothetical protein